MRTSGSRPGNACVPSLAGIFDRIGNEIAEDLFDEREIAMGDVPAGFNLQLQALVAAERENSDSTPQTTCHLEVSGSGLIYRTRVC